MLNTLFHRWLRIPYALNVRYIRRSKNAEQTIVLVHGIGDTGNLWAPMLDQIPKNINYVAVDLLGSGDSPKPAWAAYDAKTQARSLLATYLRLRITGKVRVVGHSLGSLVAVEFARSYPLLTNSLILCSPPIYDAPTGSRLPKKQEDILRGLYSQISKIPNIIVKVYRFGQKIRVIGPSSDVDDRNIDMFIKSLNASIINQQTIKDIQELKIPVTIISGRLDPLVVRSNLVRLEKKNSHIELIDIAASHPISERYIREILKRL